MLLFMLLFIMLDCCYSSLFGCFWGCFESNLVKKSEGVQSESTLNYLFSDVEVDIYCSFFSF